MKIPLSITPSYLPSWSVWHGVRELTQNARDAETMHSAPLSFSYEKKILRISNDGVSLSHADLLLGHTDKADRTDTVGKWGEGLKLGLLALVRAGRRVKVYTGSELWVPSIEPSRQFGTNVLVVNVTKTKDARKRVSVEIALEPEEWEDFRSKFLFLLTIPPEEIVETYHGDLLLNPGFKGKVFCKGIYVLFNPELTYGYNLSNVTLDRDRKMIAEWDLKYETTMTWQSAVSHRPDLFNAFSAMLDAGKTDLANVCPTNALYIDSGIREQVGAQFRLRHGELAVPVETIEEGRLMESYGHVGIICNKQALAVLQTVLPTVAKVTETVKRNEKKVYDWQDLTREEKDLFDANLILLGDAGVKIDPGIISIVDFHDPRTMGVRSDGKIKLARFVLSDRDECLATLIHEHAHSAGGDGALGHASTSEAMWIKVVKFLRG